MLASYCVRSSSSISSCVGRLNPVLVIPPDMSELLHDKRCAAAPDDLCPVLVRNLRGHDQMPRVFVNIQRQIVNLGDTWDLSEGFGVHVVNKAHIRVLHEDELQVWDADTRICKPLALHREQSVAQAERGLFGFRGLRELAVGQL